jgi:hypothetical protein
VITPLVMRAFLARRWSWGLVISLPLLGGTVEGGEFFHGFLSRRFGVTCRLH